jgi:hypothetical protein
MGHNWYLVRRSLSRRLVDIQKKLDGLELILRDIPRDLVNAPFGEGWSVHCLSSLEQTEPENVIHIGRRTHPKDGLIFIWNIDPTSLKNYLDQGDDPFDIVSELHDWSKHEEEIIPLERFLESDIAGCQYDLEYAGKGTWFI